MTDEATLVIMMLLILSHLGFWPIGAKPQEILGKQQKSIQQKKAP